MAPAASYAATFASTLRKFHLATRAVRLLRASPRIAWTKGLPALLHGAASEPQYTLPQLLEDAGFVLAQLTAVADSDADEVSCTRVEAGLRRPCELVLFKRLWTSCLLW